MILFSFLLSEDAKERRTFNVIIGTKIHELYFFYWLNGYTLYLETKVGRCDELVRREKRRSTSRRKRVWGGGRRNYKTSCEPNHRINPLTSPDEGRIWGPGRQTEGRRGASTGGSH